MREPSNEFISFPMFCSVILCVCVCVCVCDGVCGGCVCLCVCLCVWGGGGVRVCGRACKRMGSYKGERQELTNSSKRSNR
jgi:hypothetical protein